MASLDCLEERIPVFQCRLQIIRAPRSEHIDVVLYNLCNIRQPSLSEMFDVSAILNSVGDEFTKVVAKSCCHNNHDMFTHTTVILSPCYISLIYKRLSLCQGLGPRPDCPQICNSPDKDLPFMTSNPLHS